MILLTFAVLNKNRFPLINHQNRAFDYNSKISSMKVIFDGKKIIPDGNKIIADGNKSIPDGNKIIADGRKVIPMGTVKILPMGISRQSS